MTASGSITTFCNSVTPLLIRGTSPFLARWSSASQNQWRDLIIRHTEICASPLNPRVKLRLISPNCHLWTANPTENPFGDPYWAFCWPGGEALTRYIMENGSVVRGKRVLDFGCGCGSASIASVLQGASSVVANDIDHVAIEAAWLNAALNNVKLEYSTANLIGTETSNWGVILVGDMFYDTETAISVTKWLKSAKSGVVLIGDPGRYPTATESFANSVATLAKYELPEECKLQNNGFTTGYVWTFR